MFKIYLLMLTGLLASCSGSSGGSGGDTSGPATTNPSTWTSYSVDTQASLPTCVGDIIGRLYYVEDSSSFQACKSTGWTVVSAGRGITSIKSISPSPTDFCTQYTGEVCLFRSGQMVTYSDGSVGISVTFSFLYNNAGELDSDEYTDSFVIPPTYTSIEKGLYPYVARGSGYRGVYTTWSRATGVIRYYSDTNNDGTIAGADELLFTPTLTQIYP